MVSLRLVDVVADFFVALCDSSPALHHAFGLQPAGAVGGVSRVSSDIRTLSEPQQARPPRPAAGSPGAISGGVVLAKL